MVSALKCFWALDYSTHSRKYTYVLCAQHSSFFTVFPTSVALQAWLYSSPLAVLLPTFYYSSSTFYQPSTAGSLRASRRPPTRRSHPPWPQSHTLRPRPPCWWPCCRGRTGRSGRWWRPPARSWRGGTGPGRCSTWPARPPGWGRRRAGTVSLLLGI